MRDTTRLEALGIPTAVIAEDDFEAAARSNARMMGMADLPLIVIPRIKVGEPRSIAERRPAEIWDRIEQALTAGKPQRVPQP